MPVLFADVVCVPQDLAILENSPGVDGAEYILHFHPELKMSNVTITTYSLPFRFCNGQFGLLRDVQMSARNHLLSFEESPR